MAEVIDLSDDDDVVCEEKTTNPLSLAGPPRPPRCLNSECRTQENLRRASTAVKRYYGVFKYPKKTRACVTCMARVVVHQREMNTSLREGACLLTLTDVLVKDTVLLTDSESDPDDAKSSGESEFEISVSGSDGEDYDAHKERVKSMISSMVESLGLRDRIVDSSAELSKRLLKAEEGFEDLNKEYRTIESGINVIRQEFYDAFKPIIKMLPELDTEKPQDDQIDVVQAALVKCQASLPPIAHLSRPPLASGEMIYAMKYSLFARWVSAQVVGVCNKDGVNNTTYEIKYTRNLSVTPSRMLTGRQLAYGNHCPTRLVVGTRVIARYKDDQTSNNHQSSIQTGNSFYVGIVAEVPTVANKYKYLIFFDDGYAQYVVHHDIRVVTEASHLPWEDVCSDSRDFIKDYVQMYPERPMVRLQKWNNIKTEWNGKWWRAQVMEVEGSLVKMYFPTDGRTEWIYRGSTRLSPLFNKKMSIQANAEQTTRLTARRRTMVPGRAGPVVEYGTFGQEKLLGVTPQTLAHRPQPILPPIIPQQHTIQLPPPALPGIAIPHIPPVMPQQPQQNRSVAKKSTAARPGTPPPELIEKIQQEKTGYIRKAQIPPLVRRFRPHQCGAGCVGGAKGEELLKRNRNISPLLIPIVLGWRRQLVKMRKKTTARKSIYYVTPCCRRLRNIDELFVYLRTTSSKLEIDFFSFELNIDVINEWAPNKELYSIPDLTHGVEPMPISVVNSLDEDPPQPLEYCNVRKPAEDVPLNLDKEFLVCCSCTDDCQDKSRCECWQLTLESNKRMPSSYRLVEPGYLNRRLYEQVPSGIFECNSRCACRHTCQNRVVQNHLRLKLQLFKTARRGWGVRTLHDVPRGSFLCVYVGRMINDSTANQEGKIQGGDDYYAELDYIEVVEDMKEGYEDDVEHDKDDFPDRNCKDSNDDDSGADRSDEEPAPATLDKSDENYELSYNIKFKSTAITERQPSSRIQARTTVKTPHSSKYGSSDEDPDDPDPVSPGKPADSKEEETDEEDEKPRQRQNFSAPMPGGANVSPKKQSLRDYYGEDEQVYIMDAKKAGNIGRFLNHSCQPNVFVQNVFVDSQDLRFPYMSFFAITSIRAGQELTWDYAYEVGSVAGKVKYCYCGAKKCRGRLL